MEQLNFQELVNKINNAFFRLESFMNGTISDYQYFGFNEEFTKLFVEAKKPENYTYSNCVLIGKYWELTEQIRVYLNKSDFSNELAFENENFIKDCDEILDLNWKRIEEFEAFSTPDELEERKFSITDILKGQIKNTTPQPKSVFYENVPKELIEKIKDEFKGAKGKELAVLIYVLATDDIINFIPGSKTYGLALIIQEITGRQKGNSTQSEKNYFVRKSNKIKAQHLNSQSTKILINKIRKKIVDFH